MSCVICPGIVTSMMPAQMQFNFDVSFSAGMFANSTVGDPGTHGAGVAGMHGAGVGVPNAAAVAAMTTGFDGDLHMPNGITFNIGM
jgi:hypothetical protein